MYGHVCTCMGMYVHVWACMYIYGHVCTYMDKAILVVISGHIPNYTTKVHANQSDWIGRCMKRQNGKYKIYKKTNMEIKLLLIIFWMKVLNRSTLYT